MPRKEGSILRQPFVYRCLTFLKLFLNSYAVSMDGLSTLDTKQYVSRVSTEIEFAAAVIDWMLDSGW